MINRILFIVAVAALMAFIGLSAVASVVPVIDDRNSQLEGLLK